MEPPSRVPKVLLGVSGGIAAYKSVEVLRGLRAEGADVRVAMTSAATKFVRPLTFEALSHHQVYADLFPESGDPDVVHVTLGGWPDLIVIAPATADLMGKMANGLADDLLSCALMAARCPVLCAPAMESQMWCNPAVQRNVTRLREAGCAFVGPDSGPLASGKVGVGRMANPASIVEASLQRLARSDEMADRRIVVTAGRTEEDIDPVRFITNRSTGKMGYAVARQAHARGAEVVLVSGPTHLAPPPGVRTVSVRTVQEMRTATVEAFADADALIMTAAVLDFKVSSVATQKIKKTGSGLTLDMVETDDFLQELAANKGERVVVGFAMETENALANAQRKLVDKHLDLIVLNDLTVEGAGFGVDTNVVTMVTPSAPPAALPKQSKLAVADHILDQLAERW